MAIDDAAIAGIRGAGAAGGTIMLRPQAQDLLDRVRAMRQALEDSKKTADGMGDWGEVPQFQSSRDVKAAFTETQLHDIRTSLDKGIEYCQAFEETIQSVFTAINGATQHLD